VVENAEEEEEKKKKGHTPGRDHARKSQPRKKKRFRKKKAKERDQEIAKLREQWEVWDSLPPFVQHMRPDLTPQGPRPRPRDDK
jgi:hypothetical protein